MNLLKSFFEQYGNTRTYWIAYSGGMDSHVLLSLCHELRSIHSLSLHAIHINHHLHPDASQWAVHCQSICKALNIPFFEKNIHLDLMRGDSLEALAREKRYAIFSDLLLENDFLLTAHHQNDQAETVLLQLLRGAGPKGLSAMPLIKSLGRGQHARPLLALTRERLYEYAMLKHLQWIDDSSNNDKRFARNFIRHEIIPKLMVYSKNSLSSMTRAASHCAETDALLHAFASSLLQHVQGSLPDTLSVGKLLLLNEREERLILRSFIHQQGYLMPDAKKLEVIRREIVRAKPDRNPTLTWHTVTVRRYRDDLYLIPFQKKQAILQSFAIDWLVKEPLLIDGVGTLCMHEKVGSGFYSSIWHVEVRFRRGGEKLYLKNKNHTVKNLFQEWGVPPWRRDKIPLLFLNDECMGVVGYKMSEKYAVKENEIGYEPLFLLQKL